MTVEKAIEKAIEILKRVDGIECKFPGYTTALGIAVQALEKQVPKKVIWENKKNSKTYHHPWAFPWACFPNCGSDMCDKYNDEFQFCPDCGQALDWSDDDE